MPSSGPWSMHDGFGWWPLGGLIWLLLIGLAVVGVDAIMRGFFSARKGESSGALKVLLATRFTLGAARRCRARQCWSRVMNQQAPISKTALVVVRDQLAEAIAAQKCHKCGCLHKTVEALSETEAGSAPLACILSEAREVLVPKRYDCLGCPVCWPALAANAFVEAYPVEGAALDLCPTEEPDIRAGWPPLPGDYKVVRYGAPTAVCTLNSEELLSELSARKPDGLAIIGTMRTENLGIERIIKNTLANPEIRFLLLCGEDTQQAIGHLPGQSLMSVFENGLDERGRIVGARGKRPILKNVTADEVKAFANQVEPIALIGERDPDKISAEVESCVKRHPGRYARPFVSSIVERVQAEEPGHLVLDKVGYFIIYPDRQRATVVVEHYTNKGLLDCVIE
jgi:tetrahydromethanopterin S-methyltransferase subunit A